MDCKQDQNHFPDFLNGPAEAVARKLLGCYLVRDIPGGGEISARIVETEAYMQSDAASHSYRGETKRTTVMFGQSGFLYVYFTYGMHYCCNVVTGSPGEGSAVLIRAVAPIGQSQFVSANRPGKVGEELTNGPAKLCQALGIDLSLNGHDLRLSPLRLIAGDDIPDERIVVTTRIGIRHDTYRPWRFYIKNSPYVSRR
jgi:DNA-3-methyladenine glycosylase